MLRPAPRGGEFKVEELLMTGPKSLVMTDVQRGDFDPTQTGPNNEKVFSITFKTTCM